MDERTRKEGKFKKFDTIRRDQLIFVCSVCNARYLKSLAMLWLCGIECLTMHGYNFLRFFFFFWTLYMIEELHSVCLNLTGVYDWSKRATFKDSLLVTLAIPSIFTFPCAFTACDYVLYRYSMLHVTCEYSYWYHWEWSTVMPQQLDQSQLHITMAQQG